MVLLLLILISLQVVLIPLIDDLTAYKSVDAETKAKMRDCREASKAVNLAEREKLGCSSVEFSLMAEIFGGAICKYCGLKLKNNFNS